MSFESVYDGQMTDHWYTTTISSRLRWTKYLNIQKIAVVILKIYSVQVLQPN